MATRQEIADTARGFIQRADKIATGLSPADWEKTTYEQGWTVKQTYCHLASMSGSIHYFVNMAKNPPPPSGGVGSGAGFDVDAFNAMQVSQRQNRPTDEILKELRTGFESGLKFLDSVGDELLAQEMSTPFTEPGSLSDILIQSFTGHLTEHLDDIERAVHL
jgi:hypothetical protein